MTYYSTCHDSIHVRIDPCSSVDVNLYRTLIPFMSHVNMYSTVIDVSTSLSLAIVQPVNDLSNKVHFPCNNVCNQRSFFFPFPLLPPCHKIQAYCNSHTIDSVTIPSMCHYLLKNLSTSMMGTLYQTGEIC